MTTTQTKTEFLTDALIEQVNDRIKVNSIESGHSCYYQLEANPGRKYIRVMSFMVHDGERERGNSAFMFVDKETGACYKPASWRGPAKGIRFYIEQLADNPDIVDPYGSFLYLR